MFATGVAIASLFYGHPVYASLTASPFNDTTKTDVDDDPDWFDIKAELKKNTHNVFDLDEDNYDVKKFAMVISNSSYLCPTNDCEYTFKHAEQYSGFAVKDEYERQFDGTLKIKKDAKSKIYQVAGYYQVVGIDNDKQELTGETYISLGEDLSLGDGINDKVYETNGTILWKNDRKNADFSLHGVRNVE